jgi:hypothetical protein
MAKENNLHYHCITKKDWFINPLTHAFASIYQFTGASQGRGDSHNSTQYIC